MKRLLQICMFTLCVPVGRGLKGSSAVLRCDRCDLWRLFSSTLSASSPVKETPPQSAGPRDSADPDSSSQESSTGASKDAPQPKPDPDAWIQVEKRHRQAPGKPKVSPSFWLPLMPEWNLCVGESVLAFKSHFPFPVVFSHFHLSTS